MGRSVSGLIPSTQKRIPNIPSMRSSLSLILFSLLVVAVLSVHHDREEEEEDSLSLSRQVRGAEPGKRKDGGRKKKGGRRTRKGRKQGQKPAKKGGKKRRGSKKPSKGMKASRKSTKQKRPSVRASGRSTVASTCFESAMFYMKIWKDVVGNFEKQRKRMIKQNKTGGNKSGKKGLFAPIAHRLVDIGGGNKSNMSCGGSYGNKGAAQLQNLTKTLFDCEKDVNASCNPANIPQPNFTFINTCKALVDNFTTEATTCLGKTMGSKKTNVSDACTCWTGMVLNMTSATLKNCKASKESSAITAALKNCTSAFGRCRKFEDGAITAISSCTQTTDKMTKKAANLAANNASMTAAKEKMNSLATSRAAPGSRATATSCTEIISKSTIIVKIVSQNPQSTKIAVYAKEIASATVTCTSAEKESMASSVSSMESAITSVSTVLTAIQEQIETLTGSTASTGQLDSALSSTVGSGSGTTAMSTSAPSGRRDRILRHLMNNQL